MWQRAIIVLFFLSGGAVLLTLSANSKVDHAPGAEFSPVAIDARSLQAEDAQMVQLRKEARSAMRALASEHRQNGR